MSVAAPSAVAVGVFDGLHLGHREILSAALGRARERGTRAIVLSFDPHPDVVLAKSFQPVAPLTPIPEKRARLEALGIDELEVLPFTRELAALGPQEFVDRHLVGPYALHTLVVGVDFALGRGRAGNVARLAEIGAATGFEVIAVPLVEIDGVPVSSTGIREMLDAGRVRDAARWLGRRYSLEAKVVTGEGIGRTLGFPTANLRLEVEKFVPADGIYAVWVRIAGESSPRAGAMSIGVRPTFGGQVRTLEVHVLDWNEGLVGREVAVEFVDWLRPEVRFEGPAELIRAIGEDVAEVRRRLSLAPVP